MVANGQVTQARLHDQVRRVVTQMFRFGVFDRPRRGTSTSVVTTPANVTTARDVAAQGTVLPVSFPKQIADMPTASVQQFPGANDRIEYSEGMHVGRPAANVEPPMQLKGFQKIQLSPGQARTVQFTLTPADLAHYTDPTGWSTNAGTYRISVGDSSRNLPLAGNLTVN